MIKLLFLLLFPAVSIAQVIPPFVVHGNIGPNAGSSRFDAGITVQAPVSPGEDQLHSGITIDLMLHPCNPLAEGLLNFSGYDSNGAFKQMGSVSAMWSGGCSYTNGFAVLRLNAAGANAVADVAYRQWAQRGVGFFREGDNDHCGGRFICITRTNGYPSVAGKNDLVLEANTTGTPDRVLINSYNPGDVVTVLAGGNLGVGTYQFGPNAHGVIALKARDCPSYSSPGTGTLCVDASGNLRFIGQNGTSTTLAAP